MAPPRRLTAAFCFVFFICTGTTAATDPCKSYTNLTDLTRLVTYKLGVQPLCETEVDAPKWYRFNGTREGHIAHTFPGNGSCGTTSPIWMNGSDPTLTDGTVKRQACISQCLTVNQIQATRCDHYMVYFLPQIPKCGGRYCFESEAAENGSGHMERFISLAVSSVFFIIIRVFA